jgi:hypothetical protein
MNPSQYVYNLIGMSQSHIEAWDRRRLKENAYDKATVGMNREERKVFSSGWREKNPSSFDPETSLGKAYRGSFLDLDSLIKIIESQDDSYGICECYYTYLLIEKVEVNCIDPTCWDDDAEIWYKMDEKYQYKRIEKPDCFKQTCNFT